MKPLDYDSLTKVDVSTKVKKKLSPVMMVWSVQKHKRFVDIRNEYVSEVEEIARHRHTEQQRQQEPQRRMAVYLCLSLCLSVCLSLWRA